MPLHLIGFLSMTYNLILWKHTKLRTTDSEPKQMKDVYSRGNFVAAENLLRKINRWRSFLLLINFENKNKKDHDGEEKQEQEEQANQCVSMCLVCKG